MNTLFKTAFLYFNKIKVVHSIPGRMRLSVPGLNNVPENMRQYEHYTTSLMKLEDGIKEISYSYVTGKILVTYDKDVTNEKKILDWINFVWKKVVDNEDIYNKMQPEEIEKNLDKFYKMLCKELKKGR
ncbi:HMA2 domain-containing protein [uncultured Fusobacterium sp.]|uniref:HMA2 domain-containing protein n=1 Tax=uncultured Fusobacterium sp. TaxID=159267 RepID=UPI0025D871AF|nr:cation transporter [uncultured Fusobacterium sp.]